MTAKKQEAPSAKIHTTLYRAHRPFIFDDIRGQDHIVNVLRAQVDNNKIAHAYLFAGTRGTGKTSIARIFARAVGTTEKDLYEMDAASNRGVDDVRELRDGVHTVPFDSRYKVYIIDEAHMLTKEAWNALLKTLEEPPAHVVFIFATTEIEKVPDTIISRCEVHQFKTPSQAVIADVVTTVAHKEGWKLEKSAADLVGMLAEGSFRDALGVLQKVLSVSKDKVVNIAEVEEVTGAPRGIIIAEILEALAARDSATALKGVEDVARTGGDARTLIRLLLKHVRAIIMVRVAKQVSQELHLSEEFSEGDWKRIETLAADIKGGITSGTLKVLLDADAETVWASMPYMPLELAIITQAEKEQQQHKMAL
jgi:DNA polymerase-3 subunit gamma/tau